MNSMLWYSNKGKGDIVWEFEEITSSKLIPKLIVEINSRIRLMDMELYRLSENRLELACFCEQDNVFCVCSMIVDTNAIYLVVGLNPNLYVKDLPEREIGLSALFRLSVKFKSVVDIVIQDLGLFLKKRGVYTDSTILKEHSL